MNKSMIKIVLLVLTLVLIPATAVARDSDKNKGYRGEKEYQNEKSRDDDDDDDYRGKRSRKEKYDHDDDDDGDDNNRAKRARRLLNKSRIHDSECSAVDGKWARGLCYAYCEALDCDAEHPRGSVNACTILEQKYNDRTGMMPPCRTEVALSCPCFDDLDSVFNGSNTTCSPQNDPTLVSDGNGTQVQVAALQDLDFYACIGVDGSMQTFDSIDDVNGCVGMINNFCP